MVTLPAPLWWFKFDTGDNTGTSVANYGTAGTAATLSNSALMSTTSPAVGTGCLYATSTNNTLKYYVTYPSLNLSSYTYSTFPGITFSFWVKNSVDDQWARFMNFMNSNTYNSMLFVPYGGGVTYNDCSRLSYAFKYGDGTAGNLGGTSPLVTTTPNIFGSTFGGAWHHIACTIPGGTLQPTVTVYIDNIAYANSNAFAANTTIAFINYTNNYQFWDATNTYDHDVNIDDFRIYLTVLNSSQISQIYNKLA